MSHRGGGGAARRDAMRAPRGGRARVLPPLPVRPPDAQLKLDMAAYAEEHNVRGLMDELAQSLLLRMPRDPRSFLAAELARHRPLSTGEREDPGALPLPRGTFVLRLHAAVESGGGGGASSTTVNVRRVLLRSPRGNMARAQVEQDIAEQVHALLWESGGDTAEHSAAEAAEGGGHHQQRIKELEEILAELKRQAQQDQASAKDQASASPPEACSGTAIPHGLMLALSVLDDAALRREFDKFADPARGTDDEGGERRMGKDGLAALMRAKGLAHGDAEVARVLERVDTNEDGRIDFGEFRALARANSDLEQALRTKHPECVLAACFPSGALEDVGKMDNAQFSAVVDQARDTLVALLAELGAQLAAVGSAQQAAEGGKFASELRGGTLEDFHEGVTGICGEPDADLEAGMRREHTECADSDVAFSTPNYGIRTTPRTEFELVASGGSGCGAAPGGGEAVVAKGTHGCFKASGLEWCKASLCSDPIAPHFTLGLRWENVGAAEPKEGRRLANTQLTAAFESKMAMLVVEKGCRVRATTTFTSEMVIEGAREVPKDALGSVTMIIDGDAYVEFQGIGTHLVYKHNFGNISVVLPCGSCVDRMQFAQEDVDAFGFADLRSTDFVEAGGRFFQPAASSAQILENTGLAEALARQTEFTQLEWDAFGIGGLRLGHLVKAGDAYYRPVGTVEQKDVRVLRPLAYYGDFGADGRLKLGVGNLVTVEEGITVRSKGHHGCKCARCGASPIVGLRWKCKDCGDPPYGATYNLCNTCYESHCENRDMIHNSRHTFKFREEPKEEEQVKVDEGTEGTVLEFNDEGAAKIAFHAPVSEELWVPKNRFYCLYPLPGKQDTPIQRRVKLARLRRCDVIALVMYTGECSCVVRELTCTSACIL